MCASFTRLSRWQTTRTRRYTTQFQIANLVKSSGSVREGGQGSEYRMMIHNTSQHSPSQRNAAKHSTAKFILHGRVIGLSPLFATERKKESTFLSFLQMRTGQIQPLRLLNNGRDK